MIGKGEGMLFDTKYSNYLIQIEDEMLTLFVLLLTISQEKYHLLP
jgi:hypothetical protein